MTRALQIITPRVFPQHPRGFHRLAYRWSRCLQMLPLARDFNATGTFAWHPGKTLALRTWMMVFVGSVEQGAASHSQFVSVERPGFLLTLVSLKTINKDTYSLNILRNLSIFRSGGGRRALHVLGWSQRQPVPRNSAVASDSPES